MPSFDRNQIFYIDSKQCQGAGTVGITWVDLYFSAKPTANGNASGVNNPGVTLQILPTLPNTVPTIPDLTATYIAPRVRLTYDQIGVSPDASVPTRFTFPQPLPCPTDTPLSVCVSLDGSDPGFTLLRNLTGAAGNSAPNQFVTSLYGPPPSVPFPIAANNQGGAGFVWYGTTQGAVAGSGVNAKTNPLASWSPLPGQSLCMRVFCARYSFNGNPNLGANVTSNTSNSVSNGAGSVTAQQVTNSSGVGLVFAASGNTVNGNGVMQLRVPSSDVEYATFVRSSSAAGTRSLVVGEQVFQNTFFWPGGNSTGRTVSVAANSVIVSANTGFDWHTVYSFGADPEFIVVYSLNHVGAGQDACSVRRVLGIAPNSPNNILLTGPGVGTTFTPIGFTNASAYFMKSPVGRVQSMGAVEAFGSTLDLVVLNNTNANGSVRFVNDAISSANIVAGGSGYSNSDYVDFAGFENVAGIVLGGYKGRANLVTNSTGGITSVFFSNLGCGFVNAAAITVAIANSSNAASVGTGANLVPVVGSMLKGEFLGGDGTGGQMNGAKIINMAAHFAIPSLMMSLLPGTAADVWHQWGYFSNTAATFLGRGYYAYADPSTTLDRVRDGQAVHGPHDRQPVMPSRSNEWIIPWENGTQSNATTNASSNNSADQSQSNSSVLLINCVSNSDFTAAGISGANTMMLYGHFVYNNDYTNENGDQGNSWSKYVSSTVDLAGNGAFAEDAITFMTAYRPVDTDFQVFVRFKSSVDGDSFASKDWTRLQVNSATANLLSSPTDASDLIDLQYTVPQYPNSQATMSGTAQTVLSSVTITGSNTTWSTNATANIVAGSMVKLWQPLFPNNYMVSVVNAVANDTSFTLVEAVSNNGLVGAGLMVDVISYSKQAYRDALNSNVLTYWTSGGQKVVGFDRFATKVCLLSSNDSLYPQVADLRTIAVSA